MTLPSGTVTTEDEFRRRLDALVVEALRHNVGIMGYWPCWVPPGSFYEAKFVRMTPKSH